MDTLTITTNHVPRELVALDQLPAKAREDFTYITGEDAWSPRLFKYRGAWYDSHEFQRIPDTPLWRGERIRWDGYQSDTFFSGVVLQYADVSGETVIVGRYAC